MATKPTPTKTANAPAAPKVTPKNAGTVWLKAIEPIGCDGEDHAPEDIFECRASPARGLIEGGAAVEVPAPTEG